MKKEIIGEVYEREIEYEYGCEFVMNVSNERDSLNDLLDDFEGKTVKVTIEEIKGADVE